MQRIITGSVADRDGRLRKNDRVLMIQGKCTDQLSAADARQLLKMPSDSVTLLLARRITAGDDVIPIDDDVLTRRRLLVQHADIDPTTESMSLNRSPSIYGAYR